MRSTGFQEDVVLVVKPAQNTGLHQNHVSKKGEERSKQSSLMAFSQQSRKWLVLNMFAMRKAEDNSFLSIPHPQSVLCNW